MVSFRQYAMVYIVAFAITVLSIILNHAVGGGYFFIEDTDRLKALLQSLESAHIRPIPGSSEPSSPQD